MIRGFLHFTANGFQILALIKLAKQATKQPRNLHGPHKLQDEKFLRAPAECVMSTKDECGHLLHQQTGRAGGRGRGSLIVGSDLVYFPSAINTTKHSLSPESPQTEERPSNSTPNVEKSMTDHLMHNNYRTLRREHRFHTVESLIFKWHIE